MTTKTDRTSKTHGLIGGTFLCLAATLLTAAATPARAASATFQEGVTPSGAYDVEDTELRSSDPDGSYEANPRWNMGTYGPVEREVVLFPISLPTGATVTSVTLDVAMGTGSTAPAKVIELHKITNANYVDETTATWNSANTGSPWTTPGGDFDATILSSVNVNVDTPNTPYTFASSADFIAAVNAALSGDSKLRFLVKATDESTFGYKSFQASDQGGVIHPLLTITYTVPEPASLGLVGVGGLALLRRREKVRA